MSKKDKKNNSRSTEKYQKQEMGNDNDISTDLQVDNKKLGYIEIIAAFLLIYTLCVGLRFLEVPSWQKSSLQINGEKMMATHDAYFGMANAIGTGRNPEQSLSKILSVTHTITGIDIGNLAFWFPALLAPIAGLPFIFLARKWNMTESGIVAGVLTGACLGFLMRTRVGFFDNDILTLFFTITFVSFLLVWIYPFLKGSWFGKANNSDLADYLDLKSAILYPGILGLLGWSYIWFRSAGNSFIIAFLGLAALMSIFFPVKKEHRVYLLFAILVAYSISLSGWVGLLVSIILYFVFKIYPIYWKNKKYLGIILLCMAFFFLIFTDFHLILLKNFDRVISYTKLSSKELGARSGELLLPSIKQSVREAQNIPFSQIISRTSGHWFLFFSGVLGYLYLVYKRPTAIVLLPLLGVSLGAAKMGNRFTMYGGAFIGIGLGFGLSLLLIRFNLAKKYRYIVQLILLVAVIWPSFKVASNLNPAPILPKVYAQTFLDLEKESFKDARLWQWWDYGYAGQYYAERATFGDGGGRFHKGAFLFPMARVHMTHYPLQANQMIKFVTLSQREELKENATKYKNSPEMWKPYLPDPVAKLRDMGPKKAQAFVDSLKTEEKDWPDNLPDQYFVLSWENLRLAYWISFYGNWDLVDGESSPGKIQRMRGRISLNLDQGFLQRKQGNIPLDGLNLITKKGTQNYTWNNGSGIYAVLNQLSQEFYLMDGKIYKSMMVQMLINDPKKFKDNFELVSEHFPWARAYRVK